MKAVSSLLVCVFLLTVEVALTDGLKQANVVQQVIEALKCKNEMDRVVGYLNKTEEYLIKKLPLVDSAGKSIQYTFLAPTSSSFRKMLPADAANPFYYDNQLRRNVLLRHFVRRSLGKKEIEDVGLPELIMAENTRFKLKHNVGGEVLINEKVAIKTQESVPASKSVMIYVVGGLLISHDEVRQAMSRNPNPCISPLKRRQFRRQRSLAIGKEMAPFEGKLE